MTPAGFEPKIPANERPQTHALDRAATGIGMKEFNLKYSVSQDSKKCRRKREREGGQSGRGSDYVTMLQMFVLHGSIIRYN